MFFVFSFFFNDTATTEIYTLSLHDALPISQSAGEEQAPVVRIQKRIFEEAVAMDARSEEHTSELQSLRHLVCRLLLEKKKKKNQRVKKKQRDNTAKHSDRITENSQETLYEQ